MKRDLTLIGLVVLALGLASCQVFGQSEPGPGDSTETVLPGAVGTAAGSPAADLTAAALAAGTPTPTPSPTPSTPTATPTITPTPTSTPTPVPPSAAVKPAIEGLSQKLTAFRAALGSRDLDRLSTAQLALLNEADRAEQALKDDKSAQADLVREAISNVRAGASGQTQLLNAAAQLLQQAGGPSSSPAGTLTPSALLGRTAAADLATLTNNLRERIDGYQQARRERNPENLLRRQSDLVDTLSQIEQATANDSSPDAKQLRDAATALRRALNASGAEAGTQLSDALTQARTVVGSSSGQGDQGGDARARLDSLQEKARAFRSELASGNSSDLTRLQKDLLDEIAKVEADTRGDQSREASTVRDALSALRDGASGDAAKLDSGLTKLASITGSGDTGSATNSSAPPPDLQRSAEALQDKVAALKRATQNGNTGDQLRLQRELYDQLAKVEPGLQGNSSKQADALRSAVEAIKNGLSGDRGKFDEAERQLRVATGKSPAGSPPVPTASSANVDLGPVASSLGNRLNALDDSLKRGDPDAVARAQQDLQAEVNRASDALNGVQSQKAERLRAAVTAAREAAGGDPAKVKVALDMLKDASQ